MDHQDEEAWKRTFLVSSGMQKNPYQTVQQKSRRENFLLDWVEHPLHTFLMRTLQQIKSGVEWVIVLDLLYWYLSSALVSA